MLHCGQCPPAFCTCSFEEIHRRRLEARWVDQDAEEHRLETLPKRQKRRRRMIARRNTPCARCGHAYMRHRFWVRPDEQTQKNGGPCNHGKDRSATAHEPVCGCPGFVVPCTSEAQEEFANVLVPEFTEQLTG